MSIAVDTIRIVTGARSTHLLLCVDVDVDATAYEGPVSGLAGIECSGAGCVGSHEGDEGGRESHDDR